MNSVEYLNSTKLTWRPTFEKWSNRMRNLGTSRNCFINEITKKIVKCSPEGRTRRWKGLRQQIDTRWRGVCFHLADSAELPRRRVWQIRWFHCRFLDSQRWNWCSSHRSLGLKSSPIFYSLLSSRSNAVIATVGLPPIHLDLGADPYGTFSFFSFVICQFSPHRTMTRFWIHTKEMIARTFKFKEAQVTGI